MAQRRKIPADEYPKTEAAFVTSHSTGESELRPSINSGSSYLPPQLSAQRSTQNDPRNESQGLASSAFYETALLQSSRQSSSTDQLPLHHFAKNILSDWITGKIPQDHEPCLVMMACGVLLVHFQNHQLNATEHALCHDLINYTKTSLESQLPYPTQAILTGRNTPAYAPHHHSFLVRFLQYRQQQQASFPSEKQQHMNINETDPQLLQLSQMQQQRRHSNQHHQFFTHKSVQSGLTSMYPGATFARRPSASASPVLFGHDSHTVSEHAEQFPLHPPSIYRGYEEHCSGQPESKVPLIISTKSNFSSTETNPPQTSTFCPVCRRPLQKPSNSMCSVCYSGLYNDIMKWVNQQQALINSAISLEYFMKELKSLPRGCQNNYECSPALFSFDASSQDCCTRCRTLAVCKTFPEKVSKPKHEEA